MGGSVHAQHTASAQTPPPTRLTASPGDRGPRSDSDDATWDAVLGHLAAAEDPAVEPRRRLRHLMDLSAHLDDRLAGMPSTGPRTAGRLPPPCAAANRPDPAGSMRELATRAAVCFGEQVRPALTGTGVQLVGWSQLTAAERSGIGEYFDHQVLPLLVPLAYDATHPFPRISDRSLNLAVVIAGHRPRPRHFARVKIPDAVPRLVRVPAGRRAATRYIAVEDVVAAHLDRLFHGVPVVEHHTFRVTWGRPSRADRGVRISAASRDGCGHVRGPARLEVSATVTDWVLHLLNHHLGAASTLVWRLPDPLDLTALGPLGRPVPDP